MTGPQSAYERLKEVIDSSEAGSVVGGGRCMHCGLNPAAGYASITKGGEQNWYCHESGDTTCYEFAQIGLARENLKKYGGLIGRG